MSDRYRELHALSVAFLEAFNRYDLDGVMAYFTDDAVYEELTGRVSAGREAIRKALAPQFEGRFGPIQFIEDDTFIDAAAGKVMSSWGMTIDKDGQPLIMQGLDLLHFVGDKVVRKQTFVKSRSPHYLARG
ncbi:MAG: nuclear transport factor 2 family protein [Gammaproteobacteria bacterium]|nr:nuclear transport factor 2 family protein [Gammaproteobacteria bacterium]